MFSSYFKAVVKCSTKQILHLKRIPIRCYVKPNFDISDKYIPTMNIMQLTSNSPYPVFVAHLSNIYAGIPQGALPTYPQLKKIVSLIEHFDPNLLQTYEYFKTIFVIYLNSLRTALIICRESRTSDPLYHQLLLYILKLNRYSIGLCSEVIRGFLYFQSPEKLLSYLKEMVNHHIVIRKFDYENAIECCGESHFWKQCISLFNIMKQRNLHNGYSYFVLILALEKSNQFELCLKYLDEMQQSGYKPGIKLCNSILILFLKNHRYEEGISYFKDLRKKEKYDLPLSSYNVLISYLKGYRNYDAVVTQILNEIEALPNIKPDLITYTSLMDGYATDRNLNKCLYYYNIILKNGFELNSRVYAALYKAYILTNNTYKAIDDYTSSHERKFRTRSSTDFLDVKLLPSSISLIALLHFLMNIYHSFKPDQKMNDCFIMTGKQLNRYLIQTFLKNGFKGKLTVETCVSTNYLSISGKSIKNWCKYLSSNLNDPNNLHGTVFWDQECLINLIENKMDSKSKYLDNRAAAFNNRVGDVSDLIKT